MISRVIYGGEGIIVFCIDERSKATIYRRGFVTCDEEDRLSNLPENLIESILERLTVQDVVRTSIISKRWRYKWNEMRALIFDKQFSKKFAKNGAFGRNGFIRIINKVLILHKGPIIKFHLHIPNIFLDSFEDFDQWMLLLSRKDVIELVFTNSNRRYKLPSHVFSCMNLRNLKLENCFFKSPLEFEGFLNLEILGLKDIDFGANLCGTQINLPQLQILVLENCTNVYNFNIKPTKLKTLNVIACPDATLLHLLDSPCLTHAQIYFLKPIGDLVRVEKMNLVGMLTNLPRVENFGIDSYFFKFFTAEKIPKLLPHPISSLKRLWLINFQLADMDQLHGALCLLRNSPHLTFLYMSLMQDPRVDVGPASNYLESPNCLDYTLNHLHTVEITCLEGSRPGLLFIKLILAHSPSLQNFIVRPSRASDVQKRLDIAKNVMWFPRASSKAKMIYKNPMP